MLSISSAAIIEKNALSDAGAWILLLEICIPLNPKVKGTDTTGTASKVTCAGAFPAAGATYIGAYCHNLKDHTFAVVTAKDSDNVLSLNADIMDAEEAFELSSAVLRLCGNTENITWPTAGGNLWTAFPFDIGVVQNDAKGTVPSLVCKVGNASRAIEAYLQQSSGGVGSSVRVMLVHSEHLDLAAPEVQYSFTVTDSSSDNLWAYFTLGALNPWNRRFPRSRVLKRFCRYKVFKGDRCGYAGAETECDRTLARCRVLLNSSRFGGAPGVGSRGLYA
jgi:phage-related protein